jgi:hypothetical protein
VRAVGENADLSAGVAARLYAALEQRHAQEADRHLLAGRHDDVILARIGFGLHLLGESDEPVGFSAHCRNHDNQLMAGGLESGNPTGDSFDPFGGAHRSSAEFLYDQRHRRL